MFVNRNTAKKVCNAVISFAMLPVSIGLILSIIKEVVCGSGILSVPTISAILTMVFYFMLAMGFIEKIPFKLAVFINVVNTISGIMCVVFFMSYMMEDLKIPVFEYFTTIGYVLACAAWVAKKVFKIR